MVRGVLKPATSGFKSRQASFCYAGKVIQGNLLGIWVKIFLEFVQ